MKKQTWIVLAILCLVVPSSYYSGQSPLHFQLNIPFDFTVEDKAFPAGAYTIQRSPLGLSEVLLIKSTDDRISQQFRTQIEYSNDNAQESKKLIFNKYGDQRYLAQIWLRSPNGKSIRYKLSQSKRDREMEKKAKQDKNAPQRETVNLVIK